MQEKYKKMAAEMQPIEAIFHGFDNRYKMSRVGASQLKRLIENHLAMDPDDSDIVDMYIRTMGYFDARWGEGWYKSK